MSRLLGTNLVGRIVLVEVHANHTEAGTMLRQLLGHPTSTTEEHEVVAVWVNKGVLTLTTADNDGRMWTYPASDVALRTEVETSGER